ncbi:MULTISPECIES: DUF4232 domain-containing protein [unclassified Actinoplanes]|uniref:DUF4232 domain-containing protein n=1 Tax=unclassified Actinoplanes TaxID=2626549 RepID=UPI00031ECF02|nr:MULTISPECIES: DUF4232 domain-containing protein [unclassified Actinoplanes]
MKRTMIVLLAAPLLLATGCSSTGSSTTTAGAAPATTTAGPATSGDSGAPATTPATGGPAAAPAGQGGGKPASARCHTGDLKLSVGAGEGAAGTAYEPLVFTNASHRTCTLYGYPGVSWVTGENGTQVNDPLKRGEQRKRVTVTLKPGQAANAVLQSTNVGFFDKDKCKPVDVRGIRVYPPDETTSIFVSLPGQACSVKGQGVGTIWAIAAGSKV